MLRLFHFCEAILNSTGYSYSCIGKWLDGKNSRRSFHKDGFIILITVTWINLVCGSSVEQFISQ